MWYQGFYGDALKRDNPNDLECKTKVHDDKPFAATFNKASVSVQAVQ